MPARVIINDSTIAISRNTPLLMLGISMLRSVATGKVYPDLPESELVHKKRSVMPSAFLVQQRKG